MDEVSGEDIERLANRMAMLVSDDGEADNAGRAVGQLARRLGLSGGDLKQIVLAGAGAGFRPGSTPAMRRLEEQVTSLRRDLLQAEETARAARQDRDALMVENGAMRVAIYRRRANAKLRRLLLGLGLLGVVLVGAGVAWLGPDIGGSHPAMIAVRELPRPDPTTLGGRVALVRPSGAVLYREPDRNGGAIGRLPSGARLLVQRTEWRSMMQWAQVEVEGQLGYVATTEIEIF